MTFQKQHLITFAVAILAFLVLYLTDWIWPLFRFVATICFVVFLCATGYFGYRWYTDEGTENDQGMNQLRKDLITTSAVTVLSLVILLLLPKSLNQRNANHSKSRGDMERRITQLEAELGKREQIVEATRAAEEKAPTADTETRKTPTTPDTRGKLPFRVCYTHDAQMLAQEGFLSFDRMTPENLDGWFSREEYLKAVRSVAVAGVEFKEAEDKEQNLEILVTKVEADLAEYARLKKNSSKNEAKLYELRIQILKDWLLLPVIPPRMSLTRSEKGVLGTLPCIYDESMEIVSVVDDKAILVQNMAIMPFSRKRTDRKLYWISGIDTSGLVDGQRYRPKAVFQCVGTKSYSSLGGTKRTVKRFDAIDFGTLAKQAIEDSSLLK